MSDQSVDIRKKILDTIVGIGRIQSVSSGSDSPEQLEVFKQNLRGAKECFQQLRQEGSACADEIRELREMLFDLEEEIDEFEHGCCMEA